MNHFVALDPVLSTVSAHRSGRAVTNRLGFALLLGVGAAASFLVGTIAGLGHSAHNSHSRGACIALEFAENFGAVDTTQKRQALRAMTTSAGRHSGLFPKSVEEFEDLCIRTWYSEVRVGR